MRSTKASAAIARLNARDPEHRYSLGMTASGFFYLLRASGSSAPEKISGDLTLDEFVDFANRTGPQKKAKISKLMRIDEFGIENRLPKRETSKALTWLIAPLVGLRRRYVARNVSHPLHFNGNRSTPELNIQYRQPADTFNDHIRQVVDDGLLACSRNGQAG